jgi:hypothetical protein
VNTEFTCEDQSEKMEAQTKDEEPANYGTEARRQKDAKNAGDFRSPITFDTPKVPGTDAPANRVRRRLDNVIVNFKNILAILALL